jgi:N-acyl amino acid synthase of PEP-CTERM/exosortase system
MKFMSQGFRFVQAESEALKRVIYHLRYQIYVEECGFERPEDHPDGLEMDEYDAHSLHFAALDATANVIGTVRIILASDKGFPIERAAQMHFPGEKPSPQYIGEVSRLAVARSYRRRTGDGLYGVRTYLRESEGGVLPDDSAMRVQHERRKWPVIVLGLYAMVYHAVKRLGLTHLYMITEEELGRTLNKYGFLFHQVGDPVKYHGIRIPYLANVAESEQHLKRTNPDLMRLFLNPITE